LSMIFEDITETYLSVSGSRGLWNNQIVAKLLAESLHLRTKKWPSAARPFFKNKLLFVGYDLIKKLICVAVKFPVNSKLIDQHSKARRPRRIG